MINHFPQNSFLGISCNRLLMVFFVSLLFLPELAGQGKEKSKGKGQAQPAEEQAEQKEENVPKPPPDDFMVKVYRALDEKKAEKLSIKDKFKQGKEEVDVQVELEYFNWALNSDDYWDRQIHVETSLKDGYVVEKFVKNGFGELGFVKPGDSATKDVYRREKITESGGQSVATMSDAPIGAAEKQRFQHLVEKIVLKK